MLDNHSAHISACQRPPGIPPCQHSSRAAEAGRARPLSSRGGGPDSRRRAAKETRNYLETLPQRFIFVFTPTHGSWLNLIESQFSKMSRTVLRGIRVSSKEELIERIHQYFQEINSAPVVFRWKYKMDETIIV